MKSVPTTSPADSKNFSADSKIFPVCSSDQGPNPESLLYQNSNLMTSDLRISEGISLDLHDSVYVYSNDQNVPRNSFQAPILNLQAISTQ